MQTVKGFMLSGAELSAITPDIDWAHDTRPYKGRVSAVCRSKQEAADLVHWFGHPDFMPELPILLCIPGGWGQMAGWGLATAAELRDECVARWELQEARIAGGGFDFDTAREKAGLMRREDVDAATREAFMDRIRRHKASSVTDPAREPLYVRPNERTTHTVADPSAWRDN